MFDFEPWDQLLNTYVDEQGRVDYATWQRSSMQELQQWLDKLSQTADTDRLLNIENGDRQAAQEKLALWLNLYNALTIAQVLQQYPIPSIQPKIFGVPNWLAFLQFFSRPIYFINGQKVSLNKIEHGILRQHFTEPKVHFALVCASIGCPLLRNQAYIPEQVESQLEDDANRFINNQDKVYYDEQNNILYCSKIFKWYRKDFLKIASSIPAYIQTYYKFTANLSDETPIRYLPYDWQLNQRTS